LEKLTSSDGLVGESGMESIGDMSADSSSGLSDESMDDQKAIIDKNLSMLSLNKARSPKKITIESDDTQYYNPDKEYTPDKIGNMRHDMEKRVIMNEDYTKCYKPIQSETNDCDLFMNMPFDESNTQYWKSKGIRDKKQMDGWASKTAEYYRMNYNTELDEQENKNWWEIQDNY
jgi:hypothetical protein